MKILFTKPEIEHRVRELGAQITEFYRGMPLTIIVVMNGGAFFGVDLARNIDLDFYFDSMSVASYSLDQRASAPVFRSELKLDVRDRHLLIVDDVFDSGNTIQACREYFRNRGALSVRCAVLVNKRIAGRTAEMPEWVGFETENCYLVGCGMDSMELYRNLPYIAVRDE